MYASKALASIIQLMKEGEGEKEKRREAGEEKRREGGKDQIKSSLGTIKRRRAMSRN